MSKLVVALAVVSDEFTLTPVSVTLSSSSGRTVIVPVAFEDLSVAPEVRKRVTAVVNAAKKNPPPPDVGVEEPTPAVPESEPSTPTPLPCAPLGATGPTEPPPPCGIEGVVGISCPGAVGVPTTPRTEILVLPADPDNKPPIAPPPLPEEPCANCGALSGNSPPNPPPDPAVAVVDPNPQFVEAPIVPPPAQPVPPPATPCPCSGCPSGPPGFPGVVGPPAQTEVSTQETVALPPPAPVPVSPSPPTPPPPETPV